MPYWQFLPWVAAHGLDLTLLIRELFANRISAFFGFDVILSAVTALVFFRVERKRLGLQQWWLAVLGVLAVGASLGLPLFLYLRERNLQQSATLNARAIG